MGTLAVCALVEDFDTFLILEPVATTLPSPRRGPALPALGHGPCLTRRLLSAHERVRS